ncbi:unnamed protein product [Timema podura]|uniref:Uncharacterized protein n=1 Tax=Timema podura TaxID=61482 RepID=A0ABN7NT50_TIMPD|nr:unnamed protein product [Timema podura]
MCDESIRNTHPPKQKDTMSRSTSVKMNVVGPEVISRDEEGCKYYQMCFLSTVDMIVEVLRLSTTEEDKNVFLKPDQNAHSLAELLGHHYEYNASDGGGDGDDVPVEVGRFAISSRPRQPSIPSWNRTGEEGGYVSMADMKRFGDAHSFGEADDDDGVVQPVSALHFRETIVKAREPRQVHEKRSRGHKVPGSQNKRLAVTYNEPLAFRFGPEENEEARRLADEEYDAFYRNRTLRGRKPSDNKVLGNFINEEFLIPLLEEMKDKGLESQETVGGGSQPRNMKPARRRVSKRKSRLQLGLSTKRKVNFR